ncbi:hypothetical protein T440DRAFT_494674 [Plenodomus tracheiphilus IPT5]|uniref:Uncharacterized protein n=1 Tax=Plenodomus tracheiphilus IPT5 TaxID=1408161 RepID=A0A6A7BNI7_9PLEO|nr:hypothetical protein T440DRAFT_494674 [Plenodomus tracheiphilus IPT5]
MPDPTCNHAMPLTSALVFDDGVYLSEALGLPVNQNEDHVEAELALLATESGIQDPYRFLCPPQYISRALSTMTAESDHASSLSVHSQETESTSFTSAPSRTSRDHLYSKERSPARRVPLRPARASMTVGQRGPMTQDSMSRPKSAHAKSMSSVIQSALSSTSSLPQQQPRRKRASHLFSLFRRDSRYFGSASSCSSRSHHGHHSKSRGTKLECGHTLSTVAIRVHIQEALDNGKETAPQCCDVALPRTVLEAVLSTEETDFVISGDGLRSPDLGSLPDSGYSENGMSSIELPRPSRCSAVPATPPAMLNAPPRRMRHQEISVEVALANEAFTSFKAQQKEQFERVATFECNQRKALSAHHRQSLKRLTAQHEASKEKLVEQHAQDLERLEERQISAEHDLRQAHEQETQNVATALKHMEAYCLGTNANHPEHAHIVSEEDFKKLDRQRMTQTNLPRKHENAINVLRARQERDIQRRIEKQEAQLEELNTTHDHGELAEKVMQAKEHERLEVLIEVRRKRLLQRWDLRFEMWRRDWEDQHCTTVTQKLEHEEWPARKAEHVVFIPETSGLARYLQAEA